MDQRYPIGKFKYQEPLDDVRRRENIGQIEAAPQNLRAAVAGLSEPQLDTPYREGGWTVRQVVHHLADSHLNAYIRTRLALTEDTPTIKPYSETRWAELVDARSADIQSSLTLMDSLHSRWVMLLKSLSPEECRRAFIHPEAGTRDIDWLIALYSWHGRHHTAHITSLREQMGW
jgi:uncharacterized damage-inducible protein DinB